MRYPFTLYKKSYNNGVSIWQARFWDESLQKYFYSRSTGVIAEGKKEHRREAEDVAKKLYAELTGIKSAEPSPTVSPLNLAPPQAPQTQPTPKRNIVASTPFLEYVTNFWTPDSEYAQYKRDVKKNPLTSDYIKMNHEDVRIHVEPFTEFSGLTVGELNKAVLKKWLIWLAGRKTQNRKKDGKLIEGGTISSRRANTVIQSVRVAIRWAYENEEINKDPFLKLGEVIGDSKEKGVLTFAERKKLAHSPIKDYRTRLFMLLGCYCGLRRGEMRGLKWGDISNGLIHIQHNFIKKEEGVKNPKYDSKRTVPITTEVQKILDIAKEKSFNTSPEAHVLESPQKPGLPLSGNFFRDGVVTELESIGISAKQQKERVLTCHSLRHTFITLAEMSGVPDVVIRAIGGHKSVKVQRRYSHAPQVINYDEARKKLESDGAPEIVTEQKAAPELKVVSA
jgi:integrase